MAISLNLCKNSDQILLSSTLTFVRSFGSCWKPRFRTSPLGPGNVNTWKAMFDPYIIVIVYRQTQKLSSEMIVEHCSLCFIYKSVFRISVIQRLNNGSLNIPNYPVSNLTETLLQSNATLVQSWLFKSWRFLCLPWSLWTDGQTSDERTFTDYNSSP